MNRSEAQRNSLRKHPSKKRRKSSRQAPKESRQPNSLDTDNFERNQLGKKRNENVKKKRKRMDTGASTTQQSFRKSAKSTTKSSKKSWLSFFYNTFFYAFTIGLVLTSVMFAFSDKNNASIFGYRFYNVLTNSMAPREGSPSGGFYAGDMTFVKVVQPSEIKKGDILTYRVGNGNRYLTHRMVGRLSKLNDKEGDYIVTQGDANDAKDPPFEADQVLGKVIFAIPKVGMLLEFVRDNLWLCLTFLVSIFGFFLVIKAYLFEKKTTDENDKK